MCVCYIPMITTIVGCYFSTEVAAYYYVYVGWNTLIFGQSVVTYLMTWLTMDRFLAVWTPVFFNRICNEWPNFNWIRVMVTILGCLVFPIVYVSYGTVTSLSTGRENLTTSMSTDHRNVTSMASDQGVVICDNGISAFVKLGYHISIKTGIMGTCWLPSVCSA